MKLENDNKKWKLNNNNINYKLKKLGFYKKFKINKFNFIVFIISKLIKLLLILSYNIFYNTLFLLLLKLNINF